MEKKFQIFSTRFFQQKLWILRVFLSLQSHYDLISLRMVRFEGLEFHYHFAKPHERYDLVQRGAEPRGLGLWPGSDSEWLCELSLCSSCWPWHPVTEAWLDLSVTRCKPALTESSPQLRGAGDEWNLCFHGCFDDVATCRLRTEASTYWTVFSVLQQSILGDPGDATWRKKLYATQLCKERC